VRRLFYAGEGINFKEITERNLKLGDLVITCGYYK
jgi:hypothetical protein